MTFLTLAANIGHQCRMEEKTAQKFILLPIFLPFGGQLYERQINIYLFQMTRYHPCGTHYWDKAFSLNACAADQFYFNTLVWTCEIFPVKQIAHGA